MPKRIEKVNSLLEQQIGKLIHKEIYLAGAMATLTRVETTPNIIETKVYISVYPEEKSEEYFKILTRALPFIQSKINQTMNMRPVPKIIFVKDEIPKKAEHIEQLFNQLKKEEK